MIRLIPIAIIAFCCFALPAQAGPYVGASYLSNSAEFDDAVGDFSFDSDESGWKIFAGWNIIRFVGIEASYRDLGTHSATEGDDFINADINAFDIGARGILPLGKRFELFGKVGYAKINEDGVYDINDVPDTFDSSSWELMYGVGLGVKVWKVTIRAEWEEYDVENSLNSFSLGAAFNF
jgi:OOP family OmpA-OmpF porin